MRSPISPCGRTIFFFEHELLFEIFGIELVTTNAIATMPDIYHSVVS